MVDYVDDQTHEPVDKVFPRSRLPLKATLQQASVDFGEYHDLAPLAFDECRRGVSVPRTSQPMPFDEGGSTSPWPSLILNITCGLGKRDIREVGLNASISAPNVRGDTTGNTRPDPADLGNSTDWRKKQPSVGGAGTYEGRQGEGNPH